MKNTFDFKVIKCPKCGHEYLPAEVFYRDDLLGRPENIIRTENGTIELFTGENPNYEESFICDNCGTKVEKLGYTCRDHCPKCLHSKHVDIMPGDRANNCHGLLVPIGIEKYKKLGKLIKDISNTKPKEFKRD